MSRTSDGLYYQLERGFLRQEQPSLTFTNITPYQTKIIDIDPEQIRWLISYRFPIDFQRHHLQLEDFEHCCSYILESPEIILNHCSICRMQTIHPDIGTYTIVGKKFLHSKIIDGIEHREDRIITDNEDLKKLLKDKFDLIIDREIELVDG